MELRRLSTAELSLYLEGRAPEIQELAPEDRDAVLRMVNRLIGRDVAPRFILDTVSSTIGLLRMPASPVGSALPSPEGAADPAADARRLPARRLAENTRATLREARAARRSNEVRRMRGVLHGIDRGKLRETLGDEGESLCREIDTALNRLSTPVRRGRPRVHRAAA